MPVAIHDVMEPFALQSFKLNPGDTFYIFSDGFIDQFGGSNQKKFLIKNFKDVLLSIQKLSMYEQGKKLDEIFENWRKELEQVDDVTVIGIKFQ
jgi:serine phosphatase RsbU (regulator of sigma subunit)